MTNAELFAGILKGFYNIDVDTSCFFDELLCPIPKYYKSGSLDCGANHCRECCEWWHKEAKVFGSENELLEVKQNDD